MHRDVKPHNVSIAGEVEVATQSLKLPPFLSHIADELKHNLIRPRRYHCLVLFRYCNPPSVWRGS